MSTPLELAIALRDLVEDDSVIAADWLTNGEQDKLHPRVQLVLNLADDVLITPQGQPDGDSMARLREHGFRVTKGESDSFGWLSGVIHTPKGLICYG